MGDFGGERFGEQWQGLIFRLKLAADDGAGGQVFFTIGVGVAAGLDETFVKKRSSCAAVGEGACDAESEGKFTREPGVVAALGGDFSAVIEEVKLERGFGGFGGIDEGNAPVADKRGADLRLKRRL